MEQYDLIVSGGGLTGCAAAIAAAREGKKVLLLEQYGFLGGAATTIFVNPFMPYTIQDEEGNQTPINTGIFSKILKQLREMGGFHKNELTFNEEYLKLILDRMMRKYGVTVLFHTFVTGTKVENGKIVSVHVANKTGSYDIGGDYFIDTTGDADLAARSGCPYHLGRENDQMCQPMTLCFRLGNVDTSKLHEIKTHIPSDNPNFKQRETAMLHGNHIDINALYKKFQDEGKIKNPREDVLMFTHMADGVVHFNSTRIIKRCPVDASDVSEAEMDAREQAYELYLFMKEHVEGFENSMLLSSAPQIGARESRMINGHYTIVQQDIIDCTKFEDSIARGAYGVDIHSPDGKGTTIHDIPVGEYYTIPYRALIPQKVSNLIVAGRCISSVHEAQAAYRVMPICCSMGEAAGLAASIALTDGAEAKDVDIQKLHKLLDKYGCLY